MFTFHQDCESYFMGKESEILWECNKMLNNTELVALSSNATKPLQQAFGWVVFTGLKAECQIGTKSNNI